MEQVRDIILHASLRDTAVFLTMFQGLMDLERASQFNRKYAAVLVNHLKNKGLDMPLQLDFLGGRKRNRRPFYTLIYHDTLKAWKDYFDRERGWPREGDPIAITAEGRPRKKGSIRENFNTIARQLRIRPQDPKGQRTGVSPHEAFRDVVRSFLQTAHKKGFDPTCAVFWMGHRVDPYNYNKFTELEPDYVIENAKIAAEYLNIISHATEPNRKLTGGELVELIRENPELIQAIAEMVRNHETGGEKPK